MTLDKIIKEKLSRLETVPDRFLSELQKVEKDYLKAVLILLGQLDTEAGNLLLNQKNLDLLAEIKGQLKDVLLQSTDYALFATDFLDQFDKQSILTNNYFKIAFKEKTIPEIAQAVLDTKKEATLDLLFGDRLSSEFIAPLQSAVEAAVTSKASFSETLSNIQDIVTGNSEVDSKLSRYAKQVAGDAFAVSDRAYTNVISDELGAEWFKWSGGIIAGSRAFCIERHNQFFHKLEISAWGDGKRTTGMRLPDANGEWQGEMEGTNAETIFQAAGGYGPCKHSILPVSIFSVPKSVVERAIAQGFYEPSQVEVEEIGL